MSWRRPVPVVAHRFGAALLLIGVVESLAGGYGALGAGHPWPWLGAACWALGVGSFVAALTALPLVRALGLTDRAKPGLVTWVAFYLCHVLLSYPLLLAREALVVQAGLSGGPSWQPMLLLVAQFSYVPLILGFMEQEASVRQSFLDEGLALDQALARLTSTRFVLGQVLQGQRAELLAGMNRQLLPALARLEAQAQSLSTDDLQAWAPLLAEVESLANREVREFSHRLHPEAIRFGLVPALEALFAEPEVAARADLWVHAGTGDSPLLAANPHSKATLLGVYRVVEGLLALFLKEADPEAFALVELSWAEPGLLRIDWRGLGAWPEGKGGAGQDLAWSLVDARVDLLGGHLAVGEAPAEGLPEAEGQSLRVHLPIAWAARPPARG